jgi:hypothetical protein
LIKFLSSGRLKPPRSIHRPAKSGTVGHGTLLPSFEEGSVLLKDAGGDVVRVSWEPLKSALKVASGKAVSRPKPSVASMRRSLPAGVYTLIGYRVIRRDRSGRSWFVSATDPLGIRKFAVVSGKQKRLEIDERVTVECAARRTRMGLRLQVTVSGEIEAGLSIYRAGRRIPMEYRVLDSGGRVIARGGMEYG